MSIACLVFCVIKDSRLIDILWPERLCMQVRGVYTHLRCQHCCLLSHGNCHQIGIFLKVTAWPPLINVGIPGSLLLLCLLHQTQSNSNGGHHGYLVPEDRTIAPSPSPWATVGYFQFLCTATVHSHQRYCNLSSTVKTDIGSARH